MSDCGGRCETALDWRTRSEKQRMLVYAGFLFSAKKVRVGARRTGVMTDRQLLDNDALILAMLSVRACLHIHIFGYTIL